MASDKPILTLKPNITVAIISTILWSLVVGAFTGAMLGNIFFSFTIGVSVGIILFVVLLIFRFMNLRARKYIFHKDKTEFYEGFLNIIQRTVQYDKVTDCVLTKTVWDRLFGTGTIQLVTAGHTAPAGYSGLQMGGGIRMQYLESPDEVYRKVQRLLKK